MGKHDGAHLESAALQCLRLTKSVNDTAQPLNPLLQTATIITVPFETECGLSPCRCPSQQVSLASIKDAAARIHGHVRRTPVDTCSFINRLAGGKDVLFKCELFQTSGSFKVRVCYPVLAEPGRRLFLTNRVRVSGGTGRTQARGACNAVFKLSDEAAAKGVATHSVGGSCAGGWKRREMWCHPSEKPPAFAPPPPPHTHPSPLRSLLSTWLLTWPERQLRTSTRRCS